VSRIGLMLYTVREECARDFAGTLRAVAELGYEGVELFDLYGNDPAEVRGRLDELGLAVAGLHAQLGALDDSLPELAADLRALGSDRLVLSWIEPPATREDGVATRERIAGAAARARALGVSFGFHNHAAELVPLEGGGTFLDLLLEVPELWFELDLGWAWEAGVDPVELLERVGPRAPLLHVKDFRDRGTATFCPVGAGEVGYDRVLPAVRYADWLLVEQDATDGPALDAAAESIAAVRRFLA
jgi:sugar phosphate isomerase/epimerase